MERMSARKVQVVILCEDLQHEVFVRRFLIQQNWNNHQIRVVRPKSGRGSGEQFVRENFPMELEAYRKVSGRLSTSLAVVADADVISVEERIKELENSCGVKKIDFRKADEKVAFFIPKRNIETWIHFLHSESVDEVTAYRKLEKESLCEPQVKRLDEMCRAGGLTEGAPPSLSLACSEYRERLIG
jgi:hypothetical protein